jgi:hypothetical protein
MLTVDGSRWTVHGQTGIEIPRSQILGSGGFSFLVALFQNQRLSKRIILSDPVF